MNKTEALPEFLRQRFTGNWLLSDPPQQQKDWLCHAAADEIERLRAENEELRRLNGNCDRHIKEVHAAYLLEHSGLQSKIDRYRAALTQIAETYNKPTTSRDGLAFMANEALKETSDD